MARTVPDARLVYLVRDPVERIVSHYSHRTVNWPEMGSLEAALGDPGMREWLVTPSRYWNQLEQYLRLFPEEQLLVLDSDDLRAHGDATLAAVFAFLYHTAGPWAFVAFVTPVFLGRQVFARAKGLSDASDLLHAARAIKSLLDGLN